MNDTENDKVNTSGDEGSSANTESTGGDVQPTSNENNKANDKKERVFTQVELDQLIKAAKADAKASAKKDLDKILEGKHVLTEEEITQRVNDAIEAYKAQVKLDGVKTAIKAEYGLTDAQLERLSGEDEDSLKADAELLFGALKKKPAPQLNAGGRQEDDSTSDEDVARKELFARLDKIPTFRKR